MSAESIDVASVEKGGVSRRAALKAGVAAGVGAVAWSGITITSLGGTPAYAVAGCTGVVNIDLGGGCRNTDQGNGSDCTQQFRYHQLKPQFLPSGFTLIDLPAEGTCCDVAPSSPAIFGFPDGLCCEIFLIFMNPGCPDQIEGGHPVSLNEIPGTADCSGSIEIQFPCMDTLTGANAPPFDIGPSDKHQIFAKCASEGAPENCITP